MAEGGTTKLTTLPAVSMPVNLHTNQTKITPKATFASILAGQVSTVDSNKAPINSSEPADPNSIVFKLPSLNNGHPSIEFSEAETNQLMGKLKHVLVGKFSHGRPPIADIKRFFAAVKLRGNINISIFDFKHIYIECSNFIDYAHIWLKLVWSIKGFYMRVFKWNPDFHPSKESTIVPVWIRIEGLPLHMFDEMPLLQIANTIGKPIKVDHRNVNRTILNTARMCVELDLSKPLIDLIWVSFEKRKMGDVIEGFWAKVFYDELPSFCSACSHLGHDLAHCKVRKGKGIIHEGPALNKEMDRQDGDGLTEERQFTDIYIKQANVSKLLKPLVNVWTEKQNKKGAKNQNASKAHEQITQNRFDALAAVTMNDSMDIASDNCCAVDNLQQKTEDDATLIRVSEPNEDQEVGEQTSFNQKQDNKTPNVAACSEQICNTPARKEQTKDQRTLLNSQAKPFSSGKVKSSETADTQLQITPYFEQEEELQQTTVAADEAADSIQIAKAQNLTQEVPIETNLIDTSAVRKVNKPELVVLNATEEHNKTPDPTLQDILLVKQITNTGQTLGKGDDRSRIQNDNSMAIVLALTPVMVENIQCSNVWKPTEDQGEVMMAEQVALNRELQLAKEAQLLDVSRQEDTAETETQLSNIDTSPAFNSQVVHYNEKQFELEPHKNENIKEEQQIAGSFCKNTTAGKADKEASPEGCSSKAIVGWEGADELGRKAAAEQPATQDWQLVGKKFNKTKGIVTRSQTKNANNSWADKAEQEQVVDQSPIPTKAQVGFKASKSRKQLVRQMCKLGSRLNNMGSRHVMRRQLMEEMDALQEEFSLLK